MRDAQPSAVDLSVLSELYKTHLEDLRKVRASLGELYEQYRHHRGGASILSRAEAPSRLVTPDARQWITDHVPLKILIQLRRVTKAVVPGRDLDPQYDDIDGEIAYLLIRLARPQTIVEVSPCGGWSTSWLLSGIRDAKQGHLYSYDLIDDALRTVPRSLAVGRWTFVKGDIRKFGESIPSPIDYLFLDAEHSASFARWYLHALMPKLAPNAIVAIDDIFQPELERRGETGESREVLSWLTERRIPYFTAAPSEDSNAYDRLIALRTQLGIGGQIHDSIVNPGIYFRVPGS